MRESGWAKPTVVEERANARLSRFIACTSSNAERSVEQGFLKLCVIVPHLLHMTRLRSFLHYAKLSGVLSCTVRVLEMWKELVYVTTAGRKVGVMSSSIMSSQLNPTMRLSEG